MGTLKFYKDEPLFGLDIGHASLKAMQIEKPAGKQPSVVGYGISSFASEAIANGEIIKPEVVAQAMHQLFEKSLHGQINSRRVACALPTSRTFSRPMKLPPMDRHELIDAINLEAEQYIPIPRDSLYIDYEISKEDAQGIELLLVAVPKKIVDSYLNLLQLLELEPVAFEPSISGASRLLKITGEAGREASILIDIGAVTTDIAIFDKTLLVSSTVSAGGDSITQLIAKGLHQTFAQAALLKDEYGIAYSDRQQRIIDAVKPQLENLVREIQKSLRYYSERAEQSGRKISQIITMGGGAVMPGLNQYLSKQLRLPTHNLEPWDKISFGRLPVPSEVDCSMYLTAAGEAILDPTEVAA
jgi:type IV pilus assembly protein PilM